MPSPPTTSAAVFVTNPSPAVIVLVNVDVVPFTEIVKVALLLPAATVTAEGKLTRLGFPVDSLTTHPPLGAGPTRETVPVEVPPTVTVDGLRVKEESAYPPVTVRVAL
jgi:hypothetical protein